MLKEFLKIYKRMIFAFLEYSVLRFKFNQSNKKVPKTSQKPLKPRNLKNTLIPLNPKHP